ncbi:hypothetical protein [Neobacillus muris]|uniref:hypothetical protein n=1 Tax=Neobacillus muris TaxID=2941334 RepID=UPI00203DFDC8|nr:hypothetical protein [Neobacillus muris]
MKVVVVHVYYNVIDLFFHYLNISILKSSYMPGRCLARFLSYGRNYRLRVTFFLIAFGLLF